MQTFTVKVYQAPRYADYLNKRDKDGRPVQPPKPTPLPGFTVQGRNVDRAKRAAKKKLVDERGFRLRSLSIGQDGNFHAITMHPDDANADRPTAN